MVVPLIAGIAGLGLRALPYMVRGGKALIKPGTYKNYFAPKGGLLGSKVPIQGAVQPGKSGLGFLRNKPTGIGARSFSNIAGQASTILPAGYYGYDYLTGDAEQSANTPPPNFNDGDNPEGVSPGAGNTRRGDSGKTKPEPKDDAKMTSDQIKSGELDDFIKERIDLFEKYIGDDTRKRTKTAGYNAMVQFGLNLATKRGSLVEGIAESAKEPLKEFAKLGNDLMDRAASIKKAGIESGVSAYDKAQDREIDQRAIDADILKEQIKANAKDLTPGQFYTATYDAILGNPDLLAQVTASAFDENNKAIPGVDQEQLIKDYIGQSYNAYNSVEIPSGDAGKELFESLPVGTMVYYQGNYFKKQ